MKNSRGYIYVEMLAAFFICCFVALSILPILETVMIERHNAIQRMGAYHLLYEKLQAYMEGESEPVDETFMVNDQTYRLTWKPEEGFSGMTRGCIEYKNYGQRDEIICDAAKK
ncbi:hypothetical protein ELQ35_12425 [Peribacillus cavernae]|uniref:Type II secretion system protein n=1 Tax=Peribacillus cavernae TaxID=1674310 RepID=A0A3S0VXP0_9BACI|nr:competence type IV pilus minor pilin ComGE [Peribacillus cavernae]MDQ0218334.1 type II secretory pathway pseudopilin PulG [Peribacillus cavernae]RUQ28387.1 hypothetical protein ELQ35_12425 [Peribacillus cavernae]